MNENSRRATNQPASSASLTPFQKSRGEVLPTVCGFVNPHVPKSLLTTPITSANLRPADGPVRGHLVCDLCLPVCQAQPLHLTQACESCYEFSQVLKVGGSAAEGFCDRICCFWR